MPRLPQPLAILEARGPLEAAAAVLGGERLHRLGLIGDVPRAVAVELEEQRRRDRIAGLRVAVDRVDLHLVEQLDARDRDAELNRRDHRFDRALDRVERADRRRHRFGQRMQPQRDLGDHAERALRSDEEPRQVVAGRRLARARAGADRRGRRRARPSARARSRASCRSAPRSCPTRASPPCRRSSRRRRDRPGTCSPVLFSALFSCSRVTPASTVASRSSALTRTIAVHLAQVDRDAAADRVDVPFERRAGAERDDRQLDARALIAHDRRDFVGRAREADDVGRRRRVVRLAVAVMLADRRPCRWRARRAAASSRAATCVCGIERTCRSV